MGISWRQHFHCCDMSSLARSSAERNAVMVDKAFWKFMDDAARRGVMGREDRSISRTRIYYCEDEPLFPLTQTLCSKQHRTPPSVHLPASFNLPKPQRAFPTCLKTQVNNPMNFFVTQWQQAHVLQKGLRPNFAKRAPSKSLLLGTLSNRVLFSNL